MYLPLSSTKARIREAENARKNRLEIVKALADGQITRRDLFRWGLFTTSGMLAMKHGLSVYAPSAYAAVPTGTPRSPLYGATKFSQPMPRLFDQPRVPLSPSSAAPGAFNWAGGGELPAKKGSYHDEFNATTGAAYFNPLTHRGPVEGRPPGEFFAHQRWEELPPKVGFLLSIGQCQPGTKFHPNFQEQNPDAVWCFGTRAAGAPGNAAGSRFGNAVPPLVKLRYGEPAVCRIYNDLPVDRAVNGGFGRNEISTHFHNAHNGAESDGACNAYHFPGTFYDYHWGTTLSRRDAPELWLTSDPNHLKKASGPNDSNGIVQVPGDFRELQGTMWFHDHRFFFTAENVHKGMFAVCNMYSGPDRGCDVPDSASVNLMLPSGHANGKNWGNTDFDVNLAISNPATDQAGQLFFDIFDTEGFLGDMLLVNGAYAPYMQVLPRRYRFRILNAAMSRFIKLAVAVNKSTKFAKGTRVPFHFIANDGNFVVSPLKLLELDEQGVAERYDIVIDFSIFKTGDSVQLVNLLQQTAGAKPDAPVTMAQALAGVAVDPCVGPVLEFRVVDTLVSYDDPAKTYNMANPADKDVSADLNSSPWVLKQKTLTTQIPVVAPVRERVIEFVKAGGDSRATADGQCIPECGDITTFPWSIKVNGQAAHSLNANRIAIMSPSRGDVEHWTLINGGSGWDHPIHLHFEEGVTMDRGTAAIPATEKLVRKDVWRLRPSGRVKFQVRFGEFGGAYVNHCHNTVHEDFAMLLRYQLLTPPPGDPKYQGLPQYNITATPIPGPDGVTWKVPEILPGGA